MADVDLHLIAEPTASAAHDLLLYLPELDLAFAEPCEMVSDCAPPAKSFPAELDISEDVSDDIDLVRVIVMEGEYAAEDIGLQLILITLASTESAEGLRQSLGLMNGQSVGSIMDKARRRYHSSVGPQMIVGQDLKAPWNALTS